MQFRKSAGDGPLHSCNSQQKVEHLVVPAAAAAAAAVL
jgi:hypothetical protein